MYCERDKDLDRLQGVEYDVMFLDEATQLSEFQMKSIVACLRGVNDFPKRIYYTCNPGGQSHAYIKRLFVKRNFVDGEDPNEYSFIQSLVTDNKILMQTQPDYMKQLENLPPKLKEAWLHGDWDIFTGQFFEDFIDDPTHYKDRQWTNVIEPFEIPKDWKIYHSFDFGYAKPFSASWWAVDRDGRLYRILELYGCTKTPNEGVKWQPNKIFEEMKKVENEHRWLKGKTITGPADPSIWDVSRGVSVEEFAMKNGIIFEKGDNKRIPGWMQLHYRFAFDINGYPMLYVFNTCKGFIRTVPELMYSDTKPEDLDTDGEDHIADECLIGSTQVLTEHGYMPIRELVGTQGKVYSSDGELHEYKDCRCTKTNVDVFTVELENGTKITATSNHPFMLDSGEFVELKDLRVGNKLKTILLSSGRIKSIIYASKADVYNMEVDKTHDFAVENGVIVHNCRYMCMSRPISARESVKEVREIQDDPLDLNKQQYKQYNQY